MFSNALMQAMSESLGGKATAKPAASIGEILRSKLESLSLPNAAEQEAIWDLLPPSPVPAVLEQAMQAAAFYGTAVVKVGMSESGLVEVYPVPAVTEPERTPLEWNKPTRFDAFPGFKVYADAVSSGFAGSTKPAPVHPLQKLHEANPKHGSAHLL